ncbi:hypothetical protein, partial [Laspinema palackyanum]|uniref:hypothetical protein n=1 Tax=Laspinema palackyanum TaxID=3231601 RepID=UPI00345CA5AD|nr:hypothetical protein [Laspinema sp. D2c]
GGGLNLVATTGGGLNLVATTGGGLNLVATTGGGLNDWRPHSSSRLKTDCKSDTVVFSVVFRRL